MLIYPLILPDRLELVLITPNSEPARYPVPVTQAELNAAIVAFRQALTDPTSGAPRAVAQQLYQWLIAPMRDDLEAIDAETILYAPDGALRYVPLAALHDGDQWLIERFRINHITAASLQDFTLRPDPQPQILAAAFSEGSFQFQVGQRSFSFGGLPFAGIEVEKLAEAFPGTTQFINDAFSRTAVEPAMDSHTIVHLATHATFIPGSASDSFILFGNGDRLTLQEIKEQWQGRFNQVDLIVLSACETGLGDAGLGTGEEILGFGYLMQEAGAEAAIASLWQVDDGGTQVLMNAFYAGLGNGMTKAEALRQAQIALITGDFTAVGSDRGTIEILSTRTGLPQNVSDRLDHPYYWAPFILIGNGL
ncbi:CHAT domain-containing protein [Oscillatoria sp. FACHB-1407]|uniref:CHAT domain-containing protein n=1 Tax=Oscillatoria sp. FACHB-1407 TaxID=2692847 RepID=UPI0016859818|nr:CHAT domain-containing protein [Oscillatoria sp. FACHB-1407]MBD2463049.1 CHAT domain-containing protein [Oscillatoria sp. FACHB-1407]